MISRRKKVFALGLSTLTATFRAYAQQPGKVWRIGFFYLGSRQSALDMGRYALFLQGMRELGYIEGKNFVMEARFADGKSELLPGLAADLIQSKVDVIVAAGTPVYVALKQATRTIPVVITVTADPVLDGFAASLARPGGNFTGMSAAVVDLPPKYIQMLQTAVPKLSRVAVLSNPANPGHPPQLEGVKTFAQSAGIRVLPMDGATPGDIERAFAAMARERAGAVVILPDTFFAQQLRQVAELALKHRLPSLYAAPEYAASGGFMSYGPDFTDNFRRAASYVDRILKGAKAGDLPIEQPTLFHMAINRKTAKTIGITVPPELLLRADKVIE